MGGASVDGMVYSADSMIVVAPHGFDGSVDVMGRNNTINLKRGESISINYEESFDIDSLVITD